MLGVILHCIEFMYFILRDLVNCLVFRPPIPKCNHKSIYIFNTFIIDNKFILPN